jgi:ribonucleoside-diphosphate reductase alpha chain
VEPIYAEVQVRKVRDRSGCVREISILDPAVAGWRRREGRTAGAPPGFVVAHELAPSAHLDMQAMLQTFVDGAISKTVNVAADLPFESYAAIFEQAHAQGLKGCTVFRAGPTAALREAEAACSVHA